MWFFQNYLWDLPWLNFTMSNPASMILTGTCKNSSHSSQVPTVSYVDLHLDRYYKIGTLGAIIFGLALNHLVYYSFDYILISMTDLYSSRTQDEIRISSRKKFGRTSYAQREYWRTTSRISNTRWMIWNRKPWIVSQQSIRLNTIEQVSDVIIDVWHTNFEGLKEVKKIRPWYSCRQSHVGKEVRVGSGKFG
jgi:hypothetical protein